MKINTDGKEITLPSAKKTQTVTNLLPSIKTNTDGKVSLPSVIFAADGKASFLPSIFIFPDGKVFFTVSFSLPSIDDGKPTHCRLPDEQLTAKMPPDDKLAVSYSDT